MIEIMRSKLGVLARKTKMSHKQNDNYYEDLRDATEELLQAKKALENAEDELKIAIDWKYSRMQNLVEAYNYLEKLKEKE